MGIYTLQEWVDSFYTDFRRKRQKKAHLKRRNRANSGKKGKFTHSRQDFLGVEKGEKRGQNSTKTRKKGGFGANLENFGSKSGQNFMIKSTFKSDFIKKVGWLFLVFF